jgi:hypothetical protein
MKKTYTRGDAVSIAEITAFMYAGALQHPTKGTDYEHWEGHTGFVLYCANYAVAIDEWLDTRTDDDHPGVMLYELIEPMGEWMIGLDGPLETDVALEYFKTEYLAWIDMK